LSVAEESECCLVRLPVAPAIERALKWVLALHRRDRDRVAHDRNFMSSGEPNIA
jgi:hypothetical protein